MITTMKKAQLVQARRKERGQKGHSKAVRDFLKRGLDMEDPHHQEKYSALKEQLPHV